MKWVAFDVETTGPSSRWAGGSVVSDQVQEFTEDRDRWVECLRSHAAEGYTLAAHNAEYEVMNGLWPAGQDVSVHFYNGGFTSGFWFWHRRRPAAQIWDSLNLAGGQSLAELGRRLGLPKLKTPGVLLGVEDFRQSWVCEAHGVRECVPCYGIRDALIVHRYLTLLEEFLGRYGLEVKRTLAANAIALWRFFDPGSQQGLRPGPVMDLARAAIHGGRTEPFQYGTFGPVHTYDFKAHYPAVMLDSPLPDTRYLLYATGNPRQLQLEGVEGVIEAEVYQPPARFPVLPVVHDDRIYYPVGRLRGVWTICELRAALARGATLRRVYRACWSKHFVHPFTGMMGALFLLRQDWEQLGDPRAEVVKILMNAPAGRLGMPDGGERRVYRRRVPGQKRRDLEGAQLELAGSSAYLVKTHQVPRPPTTSNVLWAACIYGQARLRLLEALELAGADALYCDTDSVFSRRQLELGEPGFGRLRDTGTYSSGLFLSPKHYRLEQLDGSKVVRAKGVPRELAEQYISQGEVKYQTALGVIEGVGKNLEPGSWVEVQKSRAYIPARRQLLNPAVLADPGLSSDTAPVTFGPEGPETTEDLVEVRAER